jgi:hypothetical protein
MSKKQYDIGHLRNELAEGKSLFFGEQPNKQPDTDQRLTNQQNPAVPERSNPRTPERSNGKRIITRNSFEIYEDQMDTLRERAYQEKRAGKIGSMSAMVRDAIDAFLKKS